MVFTAGQKVRASDLNSGIPALAYVQSDITVISSTTYVDATGLVIALEANAIYALDGWIYYQSAVAADIKFNFTFPASAVVIAGFYGPPTTGTPFAAATERINYTDMGTFASSGGDYAHGADAAFPTTVWASVRPMGQVTTGATAGNLQVRFAQNASTASNTVVKAKSWLRASRLA